MMFGAFQMGLLKLKFHFGAERYISAVFGLIWHEKEIIFGLITGEKQEKYLKKNLEKILEKILENFLKIFNVKKF